MTMVNMSPPAASPGIATEAPTNGNGHSELVSGSVETIGEEKARKVLDRVDFLSKLREEVVTHPELKEKLENLAEMALDLPEWWIPGKHDHDLVIGAARHGMARMEYYILNDMELSFKDILKRCLEGKPLTNQKGLEEWEAKREERQKNKADTNGESKNGESKDKNGKKKGRKQKTLRKMRGSAVAPFLVLSLGLVNGRAVQDEAETKEVIVEKGDSEGEEEVATKAPYVPGGDKTPFLRGGPGGRDTTLETMEDKGTIQETMEDKDTTLETMEVKDTIQETMGAKDTTLETMEDKDTIQETTEDKDTTLETMEDKDTIQDTTGDKDTIQEGTTLAAETAMRSNSLVLVMA